jgi:PAS domain S-box-containing protein
MPAILGLAGSIQAWTPKPRASYLEATLLLAVLSIFCYFTFVTTGKSTSPALLYSLVPFLLWSALRFGSIGTSASAIIVASLSLWGAVRGRGPFVALGPTQSVLSLQLFLFFTSAPFLVLAALIEERKRAEAESREAQRIAHVGNWLMDKKSSVVTWSEEAYRIHGFDPKLPQPSYQEISQMFAPESWTRLTGALNEGFRSGLFPEMDLELLRPDGSKRWVADRGEAIRDATGRITQLRGSIQDITDRKQAEQVAQQLVTINHELDLARQIQLSLLPSGTPKIEGLDIAARYLPMSAVAGDFYDFIVMDEKRLGILIADVSGHGLPAALIASMLKVAFAAQVADAADPGKVLSGLNQALCRKFQNDFVTAAYLFVDTEKNAISYAGAGHPPLLMWHRSAGRAEELEENGLILGPFPDVVYSALKFPAETGNRYVLYTDGIVEAMNPSEELFGTERFMRFMEKNHALGAGVFADALVDELSRWSGRHPGEGQKDDITLLTIDFKSHG